jgi:hypothetical protein
VRDRGAGRLRARSVDRDEIAGLGTAIDNRSGNRRQRMPIASRCEWCRDTLPRTSTVNPSPGGRLSQHSRNRRSDSSPDCRPQPERQQQDHDKRCSYIQRKGGRARRSVGSGRTPGGAALTGAGLAFCGERESAPLPENRFCRSETNRRTLKPLFFHTANPRHRGIAPERRALRGEQMKKLGGGRVRFRKSSAHRTPRRLFTRALFINGSSGETSKLILKDTTGNQNHLCRENLPKYFAHLQNTG